MKIMPRCYKANGVTLIELLVVIAIIAILSTIGIAVYTGVKNRANDAKKRSDVEAIVKAYETHFNPITSLYRGLAAADFTGGKLPKKPGPLS